MADQLEHVEETSERRGDGYVNLALLTDGLRAEREQGITIDVAYRSFVTPSRRFQLADAPGHIQYTRNMVTGASTADVAVVLLDARGVIEQTQRHLHRLDARSRTSCSPSTRWIWSTSTRPLPRRGRSGGPRDAPRARDEATIPIAALPGDNVVDVSDRMPWWDGGRSSSGSRRSRSPPTATLRTDASPCSG